MGKLPFEKKQEILIRKEAKPGKFGFEPSKRPAEQIVEYGIINIDKPAGPTSHQVSAYVRQMLNVKKAGHSGTLDPAVTGVLPVSVGKATRISNALLKAGKEYICLMHLHDDVPESEILEVVEEFKGEISQLPPVRSAVKRQKRKRTIYYIDVIEIKGRDVLFRAGTQAGTYIRKLCHDMGERLKVGAHMAELRRSKAGPFQEDSLCTLQDLRDALNIWKNEDNDEFLRKIIQPVEKGIEHLPKVWVLETAVDNLCHGASLKAPGISKITDDVNVGKLVAVLTLKGELIMIGMAMTNAKQMLSVDKGTMVKPDQVFMEPGIYPKIDKS